MYKTNIKKSLKRREKAYQVGILNLKNSTVVSSIFFSPYIPIMEMMNLENQKCQMTIHIHKSPNKSLHSLARIAGKE